MQMKREPITPSVLFVCTGNICRSPLAEGIVRAQAAARGLDLRIDSAGTHDYHVGEPPDPRARAVARARGTPIDDLRARQVSDEDFRRFDLILVADRSHLATLERRRPVDATAELALFARWCGELECDEVADPYYQDEAAFVSVYEQLTRLGEGLLSRLALRS
jgi:protein-tyrosine phosphatase